MKKYEKLEQFFDRIKNLGFWQRIFSWKPIQTLSYEAFEEQKSLIASIENFESQLALANSKIELISNDNSHVKAECAKLQSSLDISNTKLASVEMALTAKNSALATREETIKQIDRKIVEQQTELKSLEEKLTVTKSTLSTTESSLASKEEAIKQLDRKIIEQQAEMKVSQQNLASVKANLSGHETNLASKEEAIKQLETKLVEQQAEAGSLKETIRSLREEITSLNKENTAFKKTEEARSQTYEGKVATLSAIQDRVQSEREIEKQRNQEKEIQRLTEMKETWSKHQAKVQEAIKSICQKHTIEYVDQVPFKGKPDNTIQICEEYIIFDAKSPSGDDLKNFPAYIKAQTESVKKYIKEANVRKDIFLVIPNNTVDVIEMFSVNMADYTVYVVTIDVLEPLILALRKIEDYEFVEQLTPEDRENICRLIGKFAHITKRKMQIDIFFTKQLIDILKKCEANLPQDIMEKVIEYEKAEKINPPQESRSKQILTKDLEMESDTVQSGIKRLPFSEAEKNITLDLS